MRLLIVLTIGLFMSTLPVSAFDMSLSTRVLASAVASIDACPKNSSCTTKALQRAASSLDGRPDYSRVVSALKKLARAMSQCTSSKDQWCNKNEYDAILKSSKAGQEMAKKARRQEISIFSDLFVRAAAKFEYRPPVGSLGIRG